METVSSGGTEQEQCFPVLPDGEEEAVQSFLQSVLTLQRVLSTYTKDLFAYLFYLHKNPVT